MLPVGSLMGQARADGSSHRLLDDGDLTGTGLRVASRTARRSTSVTPEGMQMTTRGRENMLLPHAS